MRTSPENSLAVSLSASLILRRHFSNREKPLKPASLHECTSGCSSGFHLPVRDDMQWNFNAPSQAKYDNGEVNPIVPFIVDDRLISCILIGGSITSQYGASVAPAMRAS
jgi:hypothetical protein